LFCKFSNPCAIQQVTNTSALLCVVSWWLSWELWSARCGLLVGF
jgi:hypothetical protein